MMQVYVGGDGPHEKAFSRIWDFFIPRNIFENVKKKERLRIWI